jgi:hypothetical protein
MQGTERELLRAVTEGRATMPDPKLLWFLSTDRGRGYFEGQSFDPDNDGYIAVPENIGSIISRHPELKYVGRAIGLVPLGTVHSETYRDLLMQRVDAEWRDGRLLLWGYHGDDRSVSLDDALAEIISRIASGALDPEGIGERGETIAILPHWVRWIARFGEPPKIPQAEHGILWFDTRQAVGEWRARQRELERRDVEPSRWTLLPSRLRNITVSSAQVDELWPAPIATGHPVDDLATESSGSSAPIHNDGRRCNNLTEPTQVGKVPRSVALQKPKDSTDRHARSRVGVLQRRGTYIGELEAFMTRLKPESLNSVDDDDLAQRFVDYVETRIKRSQSVLTLPQRRHIANQVAKIRAQITESNAPERQ